MTRTHYAPPIWYRVFILFALSLTIVFYSIIERKNILTVIKNLWHLTGHNVDLSYRD